MKHKLKRSCRSARGTNGSRCCLSLMVQRPCVWHELTARALNQLEPSKHARINKSHGCLCAESSGAAPRVHACKN